jgi:flagellin
MNLIQTADGALKETDEILQRMRELSVRAANEAVLTTADNLKLHAEFSSLMSELQRKANAVTFNTKKILNGSTTLAAGAKAQIGPNNSTEYQLVIKIVDTRPAALNGSIAAQKITTTASAQAAITKISGAITSVAAIRANLGVLQRRLRHVVNDLTAEDTNISSARSRIQDTDFAAQISVFTKLQILQQSGTAILAQANAQPQSVLQLLQ